MLNLYIIENTGDPTMDGKIVTSEGRCETVFNEWLHADTTMIFTNLGAIDCNYLRPISQTQYYQPNEVR